MQLYSGSGQYIPKNTTKTLHSKAGKIHAILITGDNSGTVTLYDNTGGSGTILLVLDFVIYYSNPTLIQFDRIMPLLFTTGLTVVTSANVRCFIITEA